MQQIKNIEILLDKCGKQNEFDLRKTTLIHLGNEMTNKYHHLLSEKQYLLN